MWDGGVQDPAMRAAQVCRNEGAGAFCMRGAAATRPLQVLPPPPPLPPQHTHTHIPSVRLLRSASFSRNTVAGPRSNLLLRPSSSAAQPAPASTPLPM